MRADMKRPALGRTPPADGVSTRSPFFRGNLLHHLDLEVALREQLLEPGVFLRYENARYRVLDTDPLTIEWEHTSCVDIESASGAVEEVCGRELQTGPVDRVVCR